MQARTTRLKTLALGIVHSADIAHELAHGVSVVVRRSEGVFSHHPSGLKHDEVANSQALFIRLGSKHRENRRVEVIKRNRVDHIEFIKVVLIRVVIAVPGHDIKGRVITFLHKKFIYKLIVNFPICFSLLETRHGGFEIFGVGKAVGPDRA